MTSDEPRFFIDHGMIHDRATGKHVVTDGQPPFEDGIEQVCDLLNSLLIPTVAQPTPEWPSDGEMLKLLALAGFDLQAAHPSCYYAFSWKTFTESLKAASQPSPAKVQARLLADTGRERDQLRAVPQRVEVPVEAIRAAITLVARKLTKLSWSRDECRRNGQNVYVANLTAQIDKLDGYYSALSALVLSRPKGGS